MLVKSHQYAWCNIHVGLGRMPLNTSLSQNHFTTFDISCFKCVHFKTVINLYYILHAIWRSTLPKLYHIIYKSIFVTPIQCAYSLTVHGDCNLC